MEKLAYFHSLSYCYAQKFQIDFRLEYPMAYHKFLDGKDSQEFIGTLFERATNQLIGKDEAKLVTILKELSKDYVAKVISMQDTH